LRSQWYSAPAAILAGVNDARRPLEWRRKRMREARLYFVCEARPRAHAAGPLLGAALRGGVDVIQLRDKGLGDDDLIAAAAPFREAAREHGALFILNDRPDLVEACGADGVHVGQEDVAVAEARRLAGTAALVGLSTHTPQQIGAAAAANAHDRPDQISVGPVWETPTKPGRPAAGLELVRYAAQHRIEVPWFAIGGIDASNVVDVVGAGAERVVVVRAIRDAADPEAAARQLKRTLARQPVQADA
jgi:thiamine-phosphate pyrophosphorylase